MKRTLRKNIFGGKVLLVTALAVSLLVSSCNKEDEFADVPQVEDGVLDIEKTLEKISQDSTYLFEIAEEGNLKSAWKWQRVPTFFNLTYALAKTGLLKTVIVNDLTVFAPSDDAFRALFKDLGIRSITQLSAAQLKPILLYHVVEGRVKSKALSNGFFPTLNGAAVKIDIANGVKVNDSKVIIANLHALNGVIHVIDKVLLPPTKNLVELAQSLPDFSILVQAVVAADLAKTLATGGPFTVFAPTNDAFIKLLAEVGARDLNDLVSKIGGLEKLKSVLFYHVVSGRVYSSDLPSGPLAVKALNAQSFTINVTLPGLKDVNGRNSGLVPALLNVQATNGVIHVIDRVILPKL
jgi:transforming growth factor-beta-induced protein